MAKIKILLLTLLGTHVGLPQESHGANAQVSLDAPDPAALKAYKQFWDAFGEYEKRQSKSKVEEFQKAKDSASAAFETQNSEAVAQRVKTLEEGVSRYEKNLTDVPNASNRPYVLLNLGQMLSELASIKSDKDASNAGLSLQKALTVLMEIETRFPDFEYKNEALYHRAIILESLKQSDKAIVIWRRLASSNKSDRYSLHANMAAGDWEFNASNADSALKFYDRAKEQLQAVDPNDRPIDELRVQYRIGWAAYKVTNHEKAIQAATVLLNPGTSSKAVRQSDKIISDAVELIGFSLFEQDDIFKLKRTVMEPKLKLYGDEIVYAAMTRYSAANQHDKVGLLATFAHEQFGVGDKIPDILTLASNSNQSSGKMAARIENLEKLSMLLPSNSLWRVKHADSIDLIKKMEDRALQAGIISANYHYENGLASNNAKSFRNAKNYFDLLVQFQPNGPETVSWRVRRANCLLYGDQPKEANLAFLEIIQNLKVSDQMLAIAMYQRTIALEKAWRIELEQAMKKGTPIADYKPALSALSELESGVEEYADKFPNESRAIDLLLVAAGANRDHNRFKEALRYWQRSLLSEPTDVQRSMAVRGIVFAQIRLGNSAEVVDTVGRFLKLESSKTLSQNLKIELNGVLASAATEEAQLRAKKGQNESAGKLLLEVVGEFKDVPNREKMYRDGAYMLAISGSWPLAEDAAKAYVKEGNKVYWGDMTYLVARSAEFQMKFPAAVIAYINLAETDPNHSRANVGLARAEKLAASDENYAQAARAKQIAAKNAASPSARTAALFDATTYQIKANDLSGAMATAERRLNESKSIGDKLDSSLLVAKVRYASGERQVAVDDVDSIAKQLDRNRLALGDRYAPLAAQANLFLADDLKQKFHEYRLSDKKNQSEAVNEKSDIFASLSARYDKVASLDQREESPKARFTLGHTADEFADELSGLPTRSGEPLTLKSQTRFTQNITRLRELAKRYHSNNLLAKQRSPAIYGQSEWVKKSALAISSTGQESTRFDSQDQITSAAQMEVPQQWSY